MTRLVGWLIGIAAIVGALLVCSTTALAEPRVTAVDVSPSPGLTVGDLTEVRISVSHAPDERVLLDGSVVQMGGMESALPALISLSETETVVVLQTRAFQTGLFHVKHPPITVVRPDGSQTEIDVPAVEITVHSVLEGDEQITSLSPPDLLEGESSNFAPWIVAIIGIGLGFVLARFARVWRRSRSPGSEPAVAAEAPQTAMSLAMASDLPAAEQCRQLSTAVRARLGEEWRLPASALTSQEIGPALAAAGAPGVVVQRVSRLLEACDRVQFGGEEPTPERLRGYQQMAEAIWSDDDGQADGSRPDADR